MKKVISFVLSLVLGTMPLVASAEDVLRVGVEGAYPPFSEVNASGELVGFDIDIANAICAQMQAKCVLIQQDWDGMIPGLVAKKYDAIVASMSDTEERRQVISFTNRYYRDGAKFVTINNKVKQIARGALTGKVIGVQRGTVTDDFVTNEFAEAKINRYDTLENAQLDLQQGRLDLLVADYLVQDEFAAGDPNVNSVGPVYSDAAYFGDISVGVRQEDNDLREQLNVAIKAIRDNGTYKKINDKYFAQDIYGTE